MNAKCFFLSQINAKSSVCTVGMGLGGFPAWSGQIESLLLSAEDCTGLNSGLATRSNSSPHSFLKNTGRSSETPKILSDTVAVRGRKRNEKALCSLRLVTKLSLIFFNNDWSTLVPMLSSFVSPPRRFAGFQLCRRCRCRRG